jgi:hypothetical protein
MTAVQQAVIFFVFEGRRKIKISSALVIFSNVLWKYAASSASLSTIRWLSWLAEELLKTAETINPAALPFRPVR